jgi:hypothetical protein
MRAGDIADPRLARARRAALGGEDELAAYIAKSCNHMVENNSR